MHAVDLSKDQDHLFDDPEFARAYAEANHRSCEIMQEICDFALLDHKPIALAKLLLEDLRLHCWTADEITTFQAALVVNRCGTSLPRPSVFAALLVRVLNDSSWSVQNQVEFIECFSSMIGSSSSTLAEGIST